jgi:hypothetical protein
MAVITSSPTQFAKLLDVQNGALNQLISMRQVMELAQSKKVDNVSVSMGGGGAQAEKATKIQEELLKVNKEIVASNKEMLARRAEESEAIANMATSMKTFKTLGDRIGELKKGFSDKFGSIGALKSTAMKAVNPLGIFDKSIEKEKFIKAQKAIDPSMSRSEAGKNFKGAQAAAKDIKKNEEKIAEFKKTTGFSDAQVAKSSEGKKLLASRERGTNELSKFDLRTQGVKQDEDVTPTQKFADAGQNEELQLENAKQVEAQSGLLAQIEENTRGGGTQQKASAASGDSGGGLGMLGGVGLGLAAIGKGIGAIGKGIGTAVQGLLTGIAKGVAAFGKASVIKGAAAMLILSGALYTTGKALQEFANINWDEIGKAGVALLGLAGIAYILGKSNTEMIKGAAAIFILSGALYVAGEAIQNFNGIDWETMAKGGVALLGLAGIATLLGGAGPAMIVGAAAMLVLSGALWVTGDALQKFSSLSWEDIGKGMVAMLGIGVLGAAAGAAAPLLLAGGAALLVLGGALYVIGEAMQAVGKGFSEMNAGLEKLGKLDGNNLLLVGAGIAAIGAGMAVFAAGNVAAGISNLVTGFLSAVTGQKTPVEQIMLLGEKGALINQAGTGVTNIARGLEMFNNIDMAKVKAVAALPIDKIAAMGAALRPASAVDGASKGNANAAAANASGGGTSNTVIAPSVSNVSHKTELIRPPIRNQDSSVSNWLRKGLSF